MHLNYYFLFFTHYFCHFQRFIASSLLNHSLNKLIKKEEEVSNRRCDWFIDTHDLHVQYAFGYARSWIMVATLCPPTGREVHERIEESDVESNREPLWGGWRREKLRQGLLTGSDGYHFIHDTILRLPQPTSLPSPSSVPPTTDLIWSYPSHLDPPFTFYLPSFFVYYLTWSHRPPYLPREIFLTSAFFALVFLQYPQYGYRRCLLDSILKTRLPLQSSNGEARRILNSIYSCRLWKLYLTCPRFIWCMLLIVLYLLIVFSFLLIRFR